MTLVPSPRPLLERLLDDRALALRVLALISRDGEKCLPVCFTHHGQPVPKARARHGKNGHVYTPSHVVQAERDLAWLWQGAVTKRPMEGPVALVVVFFLADQRRTDGDNLMKLVMDAATKARVWYDDSQVTAHAVLVDIDAERPRTVIALAPAVSGLRRPPPKETRCKQKPTK